MKKLILCAMLLALLTTIVCVSAIRDIDYSDRCPITRPATEFRPEKVFENAGIFGRFVVSTFDEELNKTVYSSVLRCFAPGRSRHHEEPTPIIESVVKPLPCVPTEVCEDVTYTENPSWECTRYVGFGHGRHCQSYGWVCDEDYDLECSEWSGCGHSRHCVDWECTKTETECVMTGCETS